MSGHQRGEHGHHHHHDHSHSHHGGGDSRRGGENNNNSRPGGANNNDARGGRRDRQGGERGPEGTEFLQLEPSAMLVGEATRLAPEVAREILRAAIRARLEERLGPELERLGRAVADELADDYEANLGIERLIQARKSARQGVEARFAAALRGESQGSDNDQGPSPAAPSGAPQGKPGKAGKVGRRPQR